MCPLCHSTDSILFLQEKHREYHRCKTCSLVYVPPHYFLSPENEKKEYNLHQNSPDDPGYRNFLGRLFDPLNSRLAPHSHGLDFGSGPGPTLSLMFEESGHKMRLYDPFYAPDRSAFSHQYDFITATEVVEHLHNPKSEFDRLWSCLKPDGILGIMTKLVLNQEAFKRWHYKNDLTHVCFFSRSTFLWVAAHLNAEIEFYGNDVIFLNKK